MARTWLALPYARTAAFQVVIGLSREGRARWGRFPALLGDDIFMAAMVPPESRRLVPEVVAVSRPPPGFRAWVRVRARWRRGERELLRLGLPRPRPPGQHASLLARFADPRTLPGAVLFAAARVLGDLLGRLPAREPVSWTPDRSG
ncbi:hypothetical protein [Rubellimicrobium aerolatum]|uniref:Uncharacterized protein n=1 Tax=Rubellimicrobium aerolatum TaxID=490979 RepID=A0ABW0SGV3_9RHOB|nr:hypothetical protein [Rubellimicrobium aerolatum]MBP1807497.1 hypothetical protein [Rubellimicrobium aerolatum]